MSNTHVASQGSRDINMLDSLLLPDTSPDVRRLYYKLEETADSQEFGPLEDGVVVLDTETTGLSFRDCELIEIAAARLEGREVVERFQTFVQPGKPIPRGIQKLTNISDLDVANAPTSVQAVEKLAAFVGGAPVIAHNALFDRTFVEKVPGGKEVSDFWIDSLALSRIALPRLRSHRLSDMAQAFHCDSVTHRAEDDVDALCGMWRILLCGLSALPDGLLAYLADMHPEIEWSFRPILSYIAGMKDDENFDLKAIRKKLFGGARVPIRKDVDALDGPLDVPQREEVEGFFSQDGPLAKVYPHYERRDEQVRMALEIREAITESRHCAIEAGTGVGKSIAYLIPELLFAKKNGITVGVATKTNALTDQLVSHELPNLDRAIPGGITYYSLKGYEHYPCLLRMDRSATEDWTEAGRKDSPTNLQAGADQLTALAVAYAFACQSGDGDLDTLGIRWKVVPRELLTTTPGECIRGRCPYYPNECFLHGARRRAASADLVVTNHALLLRDIAADNALLPPIRYWVVDEAHSFENEARRQWSLEVSGEITRSAFETLGDSKTGLLHDAMVEAGRHEASALNIGVLAKASAATKKAQASLEDFFIKLNELVSLAHNKSGYGSITLWVDEKLRNTDIWGAIAAQGNTSLERVDAAVAALNDARETIGEDLARIAGEIAAQMRILRNLSTALRLVFVDFDQAYVYSAEVHRQRKRLGQDRLVAERLDIGEEIQESWLSSMRSVVFTSATLAIGNSFEHFDNSVGLDRLEPARHCDMRLASSFDFDKQMAVVVAEDMPQPNERGYLSALADLLVDIHESMGGSVLTLFTNRNEMESVFHEVEPRLASQGLKVLCQERGNSPRRLRESFLSGRSVSLFALKSFWEGFDAAGDTLRCVVIVKLPFSSPQDPLVRERDLRDRRAWWRYSLPEAVISVKQAAGRLIRSSEDEGILVIADSRVAKKRYGKQVLDSLPSHNRIMLGRHNLGRYIKMWRQSRRV